MRITKPNRPLKRKNKKGRGCKMCKPHKGKWAKRLKVKELAIMEEPNELEND